MKHYSLLIIALTFLISTNSYSQFSGGAGTAAAPYQITSRADMEALADSVNSWQNGQPIWSAGKHFELMNDITDSVRTLIGNGQGYASNFHGSFDGGGHKITLAINHENAGVIGLFAHIYNAKIYDLAVDGYVNGEVSTGGICGFAEDSSIISGCINYCNITSKSFSGGICGEMFEGCSIANCVNYGNVIGTYIIGGICGNVTSATISACKNYGNITAQDEYAGGIIGTSVLYNSTHTLSDCHNYGDITGKLAVGGIAGCIANQSVHTDISALFYCANSGTITATTAAGGITGHSHENTTISHCLNVGTVRADSYAGGIASGFDNMYAPSNGAIHTCHNAGLIAGSTAIGGIVGRNRAHIMDCLNTGVVMRYSNSYIGIGPIAGDISGNVAMSNCHYDKQMTFFIEASAKAYFTKELVGNVLSNELGTADWTFDNANLYPTLKYFAKDSVGLVARSPVYFDNREDPDHDWHGGVNWNFKVNIENNVKWDGMLGDVNIVNDDGILVNDGSDTLVCSIGNQKKLVPINIAMPSFGDVRFTIWATDHKLVAPSRRNYRIPIYIKADANTSRVIMIRDMLVEIDKDVFYAKRSDNGTIGDKHIDGNMVQIPVKNIRIPVLKANEETILFHLIGDMLLANVDSSGINIDEPARFVSKLNTPPVQINGSITLDICREGNDRFIANSGNMPYVLVKNNPADDILQVECNVVDSGHYALDIIDMTGRCVKTRRFLSKGEKKLFNFVITTENLSVGNYLLVLTTQTDTLSTGFVIKR